MEQLHGGFTLDIPAGCFPLSTDSMVLAHFVRLPRAARVLDLGSGCGTLGVLLCARDSGCIVTGVELEETAHAAALDNIRRNGLSSRLCNICADLRTIPQFFSAGSFDVCVSNPPYFSGGAASIHAPAARRTDFCQTEALFAAAGHALRWGGDFFLVHRPEALGSLIAAAASYRLEAKRLTLVRHSPEKPVNLILLSFRKGGKPGLILEELTLFESTGEPTQAYRDIYHPA